MLSDSVQRMGLGEELTPSKKAQMGQHQSPLTVGASGDVSNKKRSREEMISGQPAGSGVGGLIFAGITDGREAQQIENLMQGLRQKVLNGETLNNFKKEIA